MSRFFESSEYDTLYDISIKVTLIHARRVVSFTRFTVDLSEGDRGDAVRDFQHRLRELGFFTYSNNTGYFGTVTISAVNAYRSARSLDQNGMVDLPMRSLLEQEL